MLNTHYPWVLQGEWVTVRFLTDWFVQLLTCSLRISPWTSRWSLKGWKKPALWPWRNLSRERRTDSFPAWTTLWFPITCGWARGDQHSFTELEGTATSRWRYLQTLVACWEEATLGSVRDRDKAVWEHRVLPGCLPASGKSWEGWGVHEAPTVSLWIVHLSTDRIQRVCDSQAKRFRDCSCGKWNLEAGAAVPLGGRGRW